ncbi:hypothetical protein CTAYLR_005810 [Chrysophaeum taylorii]|uniref:ABC transporter domain-containing protein n=1 Tax=Chrysophaeum taylorii TaxID=2483200 RepID=A0AAD7UM96_9STRA|nr:hypothetical protein CTAYLR_005810 [Chrysophaeum taylorii]
MRTQADELEDPLLEQRHEEDPPMIAFEDLRYSIKDKVILDGVTGSFYRFKMSAIMGTSGAGKTTLIDLLAARRSLGKADLEGKLQLGGAWPTDVVRKRYTGFCEQQDTLVSVLTVRETFECTAELKCATSVTRQQKLERVGELIRELGLEAIADSVVGGATATTRGISGGQRKRVNIGNALITKPPILFLDEPTTGLDSATADDVLSVAASLARDGGRAVVATLHSPSSRAFRLFVDKVLCLGTGGRVLWCAPTGTDGSGPLAMHLAACGIPYVEGDSLADTMMYVFGGGTEANPEERSLTFAKHWHECEAGATEASKVASAMATMEEDAGSVLKVLGKATEGSLAWDDDVTDARRVRAVATTRLHGILTLFYYRSLNNFTDYKYVSARLGDKIFLGLVLASLFWGEGSQQRSEKHVSDTVGLIWFACVIPGYSASSYMPTLVMERPVFIREVADGCYLPSTYLVAKLLEEWICLLPFSLCFVLSVYYSVSLQGSFIVLWLVSYLTGCIGVAIAYTIAAFSPNLETANSVLPTYITINILFCGYVIIYPEIPLGWRWYAHIDWFYYGWTAGMKNNFRQDHPFSDSDSVLDFYYVNRAPSIFVSMLALIAFTAFFSMTALIFLNILVNK